MSIHRSLKVKEGLMRSRNVWTRLERIESLKKAKKLGDEESVFGLPKVRTGAKIRKKVKEKKAVAVVAGAAGEGGAAEAGAKPDAKGGKGAAKAAPAAGGKGGPAKAAPAGKPAGKPAGGKK